LLTTDPLYWESFQPKIEIKNLVNTTTYYTFDAFADITTNKVVYCKVDLGIDHHGTFEIQIENSNQALDTTNIKKGQRVIISVKKDATLTYNRLISGLIRKTGYTRGIGGQALYTIQGSSTAIRLNERITYFVRAAAKLVQDNITIDITDPNMKADTLLQSLIDLTGEAYTASSLATNSDVENFIPSIADEFGELQDGVNTIEEQSTGELFIDVNDVAQFRHQLQPATVGKGFILRDTVGSADDADTTCYYDGQPEYWESIFKSDGFASRIYGILPAETVPSTRDDAGFRLINGTPATAIITTTQEAAAKFRPTHSHFLPGDIFIVGGENASAGSTTPWVTRFRICTDNAGVPTNVGGIIANIDFQPQQFQSPVPTTGTDESLVLASDQIFYNSANVKIDSFDLNTTQNYWLICSNDNLAANHQFSWTGVQKAGAITMFTNTTLSTNSAGGAGWALGGGGANVLMNYALPRRRSEAFECSDHKAIANTGSGHTGTTGAIIESTLSNIPSVVKTREGMYKYMANQIYYMARPQVIWPTFRVSVPNIPILPNDPLMIVDSTLSLSTPGSQAVTATTGVMSYEFGTRGGVGNSIQSSLYLNITPVGFATHY
jgi:hypothetical protein